MKTRVAFCLVPTPLCRAARRLAKENYRAHRAACHPFVPIDTTAIVQVSETEEKLTFYDDERIVVTFLL